MMGGNEGEEATMAEMPRNFRNMRACLSCSLVKSFDQVSQPELAFDSSV